MPFRRLADEAGTFGPETIQMLSDTLESVWSEVAPLFEEQEQIDNARSVIARSLLYHASNGHTDGSMLKALALEALDDFKAAG